MMMSVRRTMLVAAVAVVGLVANGALAFTATSSKGMAAFRTTTTTSQLGMVPKFDPKTKKWAGTTKDDEEGYDIFETVVRNGPLPFIQRVINADEYEQGVLKYMALEKCGRREAQGNMDASLENAADWAYQKMQEKNGGAKKDYAKSPTQKQFGLSGAWALIVFWFFGTLIGDSVAGKF
jgi:hypothetical protein